MKNKYKFVDQNDKTVRELDHPERVVPQQNQVITVLHNDYKVDRSEEFINFNSWERTIIIYMTLIS